MIVARLSPFGRWQTGRCPTSEDIKPRAGRVPSLLIRSLDVRDAGQRIRPASHPHFGLAA